MLYLPDNYADANGAVVHCSLPSAGWCLTPPTGTRLRTWSTTRAAGWCRPQRASCAYVATFSQQWTCAQRRVSAGYWPSVASRPASRRWSSPPQTSSWNAPVGWVQSIATSNCVTCFIVTFHINVSLYDTICFNKKALMKCRTAFGDM